jgi:hypothetical protein
MKNIYVFENAVNGYFALNFLKIFAKYFWVWDSRRKT